MHLHKFNDDAYCLETSNSTYALYVYGSIMAYSTGDGDIFVDEMHTWESDQETIDTVNDFVELVRDSSGSDSGSVFFIDRKLLTRAVRINH